MSNCKQLTKIEIFFNLLSPTSTKFKLEQKMLILRVDVTRRTFTPFDFMIFRSSCITLVHCASKCHTFFTVYISILYPVVINQKQIAFFSEIINIQKYNFCPQLHTTILILPRNVYKRLINFLKVNFPKLGYQVGLKIIIL